MASEEDNFDIDIYGDGGDGEEFKSDNQATGDVKAESDDVIVDDGAEQSGHDATSSMKLEMDSQGHVDSNRDHVGQSGTNGTQPISTADGPAQDQMEIPKQAPQEQGVMRKDGSDERPIDPNATNALLISDLHWWSTDDDIRGWVNQSECEDELKDITFSEHKVNGKSKG